MMSVRLTGRGEKFLRDFLPSHFQAITSLMGTLSEGERKTFVRLLAKVQQQALALNLKRDLAAGSAN